MKKINYAKKYMKEIRLLFPATGREENKYLKQMKANLQDYCESNTVTSVDELYAEFGEPQDVVYGYYSIVDRSRFFSYIHLRKAITAFLTFIGVMLLAVTLYLCMILYQEHLSFMRSEAAFTTTEIIE